MSLMKKLPLPMVEGIKVFSLKLISKFKFIVEVSNSVLKTEPIEALQYDLESLKKFKASFEEYKKSIEDYERYADLVYHHFMLRHIVAYYEARTDESPVQVYNEYRMSFDHYMRGIQTNNKGHEKKALDHLLRANLDIVKLICNWLRKNCEKKHRWVPKKALGIISNGEYIKDYTKRQVRAERLLREAKESEILSYENNIMILDKFLMAFLKHKEWNEYQENNFKNVIYTSLKYYLIVGLPLVISTIIGAVIGFFLSRLFDGSYKELFSLLKGCVNLPLVQ